MDFTHRWPPESLQPPLPPPGIHHPYNPYPRPALRPPSPTYYPTPNPNAYICTPLRPPPPAESSRNVSAGKGLAAYYYERIRKDLVGFGQKGSESNNKKGSKLTKAVQSARCDVCKIECNTQEVLDAHKQGKKHKRKLQLLQEKITAEPDKSQVTTNPEEIKEEKKRKDAAPVEDLETKKRRILEGGGQPIEHIAGSKRAAEVKKQQEAAAASGSSQKDLN